jgi:hypothetical protein
MPSPSQPPSLIACLLIALALARTATPLPAQPALPEALSLRTSAWLHDIARRQGYPLCALYAEAQAPGSYRMDVRPDSVAALPGMRLFRVRLQPGTWVHTDGSAMILVCKHTGEMDDLHLVATYDAQGQLRVLSGATAPDSAHTWVPAPLPLRDHALVRLSYLQPVRLKAGPCNARKCVFRAYSELLGKRVAIHFDAGQPDAYTILCRGWKKKVLYPTTDPG